MASKGDHCIGKAGIGAGKAMKGGIDARIGAKGISGRVSKETGKGIVG